jgi:type VI protein secretion system component VasF
MPIPWAKGERGERGDHGDTGQQGAQGQRGIQGPRSRLAWWPYVVMGVAVMVTLFVFQQVQVENDRRNARARIAIVEASAYRECLANQELREELNRRLTRPFHSFAHDAAVNRKALARDRNQARSVRVKNAKAAARYYKIAAKVKDFTVLPCR